jgi:Tfp pilus assembly protein PilN
MKISLDLLPEERKEQLKSTRLFRKVIWFEIVFLFPIFVMIVILLDSLYVLNYEKDSVAKIYARQQDQQQYQNLKDFQDSFKQANNSATTALNFQNKNLHWTNVLRELGNIFPDNVSLSEISTKDFQIIITGSAKTRQDLLNLQSQLQQSVCFQNVDVPLSDMIQKSDIEFQVDFYVKTDCLNKKI